MKTEDLKISLLLASISILIVAIIIYKNYKKRIDLKKNGIKTTGVVLDIEIKFMPGGRHISILEVPIIQFVTKDGTWIKQKKEGVNYSTSLFSKGEKVIVYYDVNSPTEFLIEKV